MNPPYSWPYAFIIVGLAFAIVGGLIFCLIVWRKTDYAEDIEEWQNYSDDLVDQIEARDDLLEAMLDDTPCHYIGGVCFTHHAQRGIHDEKCPHELVRILLDIEPTRREPVRVVHPPKFFKTGDSYV